MMTADRLYTAAVAGAVPGGQLPMEDRYRLIRDLHGIGWTDEQIADHTHGTLSSITAARQRMGLPSSTPIE